MQDPSPENIMGQKRVSHSVEWQINVGHALLGVLGLYFAWKLFGGLSVSSSSSSEHAEEEPAVLGQLSGSAEQIEVE